MSLDIDGVLTTVQAAGGTIIGIIATLIIISIASGIGWFIAKRTSN